MCLGQEYYYGFYPFQVSISMACFSHWVSVFLPASLLIPWLGITVSLLRMFQYCNELGLFFELRHLMSSRQPDV